MALLFSEKEEEQKCKWQNMTAPPGVSISEKRESEGKGGMREVVGWGGGWGKTSGKKKKKPQQAIRLIFSQPGLWVHCLVFAGAQAVCPGGATF